MYRNPMTLFLDSHESIEVQLLLEKLNRVEFSPTRILGHRNNKCPAIDRFLAKIQVQPDSCWIWHGNTRNRYGIFPDENRRLWIAHRWIYTYLYGPIPSNLHLDHLCRNPSCVKPTHLEAVSQQENNRRQRRAAPKMHCFKGHLRRAVYAPCLVCKREYYRLKVTS